MIDTNVTGTTYLVQKVGRDMRDRGAGRILITGSSRPAMVAEAGFAAMMKGGSDVTSGITNKILSAVANVTPNELLAKAHRKMAEPGTGRSGSAEPLDRPADPA